MGPPIATLCTLAMSSQPPRSISRFRAGWNAARVDLHQPGSLAALGLRGPLTKPDAGSAPGAVGYPPQNTRIAVCRALQLRKPKAEAAALILRH
jgi:hypothetical protein